MTLQALLTGFKKLQARYQTRPHHSPITPCRKPKLTQAFRNAKHFEPAHLEQCHLTAMSTYFQKACPSDDFSPDIFIATDKTRGSFQYQENSKHSSFDSCWDDPYLRNMYNLTADELGRSRLRYRDDDSSRPGITPEFQLFETSDSIDSVIDIKAVTELEAILVAGGVTLNHDVTVQRCVQSGPSSPESEISPSISWVSFEGFAESSDISADNTDTNDSTAIASMPEARANVGICMSSGVNTPTSNVRQDILLSMDPVFTKESEVFALMGFGHAKVNGVVEAPVTTALYVGQPVTNNTTPDIASSSSSSSISSYRKWARVEGAKIAMLAIQDVPLLDMPDTPPRFKKHARPVISTAAPSLPISTSDSFRKWRRIHGKKMSEAIMRSEPLPDIPDTPPRFRRLSIDASFKFSAASDVTLLLDTYRTALKNVADKLEAQGCASFTATSENPVIDAISIDDDYVVIDPTLSNIPNLPGRAFNMRRIAHKVKELSHRGIGKPSSSDKADRTVVSPFSSKFFLSCNSHTRK